MEPPTGSRPPEDPIPWQTRRLTWFVIFGGMASSVILYRVILGLLGPQPAPPNASTLRIALYAAAALTLLASIAWTRSRLEPPGDTESMPSSSPQPPMPQFITASVVAMALAEASSVLGFVLVCTGAGAAAEYLAFGAGTFLVLALVILPRGLKYWGSFS
jgi:hypothetical protein